MASHVSWIWIAHRPDHVSIADSLFLKFLFVSMQIGTFRKWSHHLNQMEPAAKKQVNSIERGNKYDFVRKCASDVKMNSRNVCGYIK